MTLHGPFHSKKLGWSIGVDLLPTRKTCTFNCAYCELGPTTGSGYYSEGDMVELARSEMEVLEQSLASALTQFPLVECIAVGYNGEPTLVKNLRLHLRMIKRIRNKTRSTARVSIFTNSSTISRDDVKLALSEADHVLAKLDAGNENTFATVDRPHHSVPRVEAIVKELSKYKRRFKGCELTLLTMLVNGVVSNTTGADLRDLALAYRTIGPDSFHLYTMHQMPPDASLRRLSMEELQDAKNAILRVLP